MPRLSTCKLCEKQITKEEKFIYSNKSYCKTCYDIKIKDHEEYTNLINSICIYFSINKPTGLILKQLKEYKEKFDYTYGGMSYCLWYITEILNKKLDVKYGVAIIKFEYENAKDYFNKQQSIRNSLNKPLNNEVTKKVQIKVKKTNNNFLINLDKLGGE